MTAKGDKPEEDRLLYTFVNGQLVPATNLPQNAFQNGSIQLFSSSSHKMIPVEEPTTINSDIKTQSKKKENPPAPVVQDKKVAKEKKKSEKKKEVPVQNVKKDVSKKKESKQDDKASNESKVDKDKKKKKAYIDPEFAANPFKLLDDDGDEIVDSTEEEIEEPQESVPRPDAEEVKKPQTPSQNTSKSEKPSQKNKQAVPHSQKSAKTVERQESVTSNNSKDSKQSKKQQKKVIPQSVEQQNYQPFPLHPQYHQQPPAQTIYKPADYVSAAKKPSQQQYPQTSQLPTNSIMDQLNRGVKVEGLRLPPGITLTKVSPSNAETYNVHHKRETINRV